MQVCDFLPYLGHSEKNPDFANLLVSLGVDPTRFAARAQRNSGQGFFQWNSEGIDLTLDFHTKYRAFYGEPKTDGKVILSGFFIYPLGQKTTRRNPI